MLPKLGKFLQAAVPFDRVKSDAFGMGVILLKFRVRGHFQFPFYQAWAARNSKLLFVRDMNSKSAGKDVADKPTIGKRGSHQGGYLANAWPPEWAVCDARHQVPV
jgi:hypothetical protein